MKGENFLNEMITIYPGIHSKSSDQIFGRRISLDEYLRGICEFIQRAFPGYRKFTDSYDNGVKEYEIHLLDGVPHGEFIRYYRNGEKEYEIDFFQGIPHGKFTKYYENGMKEYVLTFFGGVKHGKFIIYDEKGRITHKKEYVNGEVKKGWLTRLKWG